MSKKKAFGGSTMTLKDFHDGSIPSELPLPSAPGVSARQQNCAGLDRAVGGARGRMDPHRPSRPGSAGASVPRSFDEPSSFLPSTARIGRHFDEDERKPFEASSAPRRVPAPDPEPGRLPINKSSKQQLFGRPVDTEGCSHCGVQKTPQWRTGPMGAKTSDSQAPPSRPAPLPRLLRWCSGPPLPAADGAQCSSLAERMPPSDLQHPLAS